MPETDYIVEPLSRPAIRKKARLVRQVTGFDALSYFPIANFLENELPQIFEEFAFIPREREALGPMHARTFPSAMLIEVREDVYHGARLGRGRDRMTLAHEFGHLCLHQEQPLARTMDSETVPAYRCAEWQAKAYAGELLIPHHLRGRFGSPAQVARQCGVSLEAAEYHWKKVWKRDPA